MSIVHVIDSIDGGTGRSSRANDDIAIFLGKIIKTFGQSTTWIADAFDSYFYFSNRYNRSDIQTKVYRLRISSRVRECIQYLLSNQPQRRGLALLCLAPMAITVFFMRRCLLFNYEVLHFFYKFIY